MGGGVDPKHFFALCQADIQELSMPNTSHFLGVFRFNIPQVETGKLPRWWKTDARIAATVAASEKKIQEFWLLFSDRTHACSAKQRSGKGMSIVELRGVKTLMKYVLAASVNQIESSQVESI